jgi:hypothetical protein
MLGGSRFGTIRFRQYVVVTSEQQVLDGCFGASGTELKTLDSFKNGQKLGCHKKEPGDSESFCLLLVHSVC